VDVAALAGRLKALAADLPLPALDTADQCLEAAQAELRATSRDSNAAVGLHKLGAARERLDSARRRMGEAATAIDGYLDGIGAAAAAAPIASAPQAKPVKPPPLDPRQWWTDRVNELCDRNGAADPQQVPPTRLFNELLRAAGEGDGEAYCKHLRDAGPQTGVKLPGLAWPLVRALAAEHLRRRPTARDVPGLRDKCSDRVRSLVPNAEPDHIGTALASACTLGRNGGDDNDAARTAAMGPALVAALHRLSKSERRA
jgi:hypothetical protein